ncbi:MAG: hypothetical protein HY040_01190 [Planctomycetes bacterium]|nr:hypothetical protein [Planctomycetota bacterium]
MVTWGLAGGLGAALVAGLGKLVKDFNSHRRREDRPLAPWEREPGPV